MSYKMRRDERGKLHKVVVVQGIEGYIERWTSHCSGCTEVGDYGHTYGSAGCEECGYTGKRRREWWEPFDWNDIPPSRFDHLASEVVDRHGLPE